MLYWAHEQFPFDKIKYDEYVERKNGETTQYYNLPVSFDIETSSFYDDGEQRACMYCWQMCFDYSNNPNEYYCIFGRTWDEFIDFIKQIVEYFKLNINRRMIIYVHNLAYEFTFIRRLFEWEKVFSIQSRRPIQAVTTDGVEFRCSYILSGMSLAKVGDNLTTYHVNKLSGDLDYRKLRHSTTPITTRELLYCINDVKVVCAYIKEKIQTDGSIIKIPLTKTGYVRNDVRQTCFGKSKSDQNKNYRALMKRLYIREDEYILLERAFQGGFCHANAWYVENTIINAASKDITSSYPTVMFEQFPMSYGEHFEDITMSNFLDTKDLYCWVLEIAFKNIRSKVHYEHYISYSRCYDVIKPYEIDNGRLVYADEITTTITNVDFDIISKCYEWDGIKILQCYRYKKDYLPKAILERVLYFYGSKTMLKGVEGKEVEYLKGKENVNSIYGMSVQKPVQELNEYDEDSALWFSEPKNLCDELDKYNKNHKRFLFYPWGVFITAYARRNLWRAIFELKDDYIYADTDSVKYINEERHEQFFKDYNNEIIHKLEATCKHYNIPPDKIRPSTIKGTPKPLGVWESEGVYKRFKTLGAKRYMYDDGNIHITVAGLNKSKGANYMVKQFGYDKCFDYFKASDGIYQGLQVPPDYSGRMVMTYIDDETEGEFIDYLGNVGHYHELTSVHMENTTYEINYGKDYVNYLNGLKEVILK